MKTLQIYLLLTVASFFVLVGCKGASEGNAPGAVGGTDTQPLVLSPISATTVVNASVQLSASGGIAPYTFSIVSGGGTIVSVIGEATYTAPAAAGTAIVKVEDAQGTVLTSTITINPALSISPTLINTATNDATNTFMAAGGVSPYTYSIVSGGGSINPSTGAFTAPASAGSVVVRVTDSLSNTADANVNVVSGLAIAPATATIAASNSITFTTTGGLSPYIYSIVGGGGNINSSTGVFTAPATASTVTVRVTDTLGQTADAVVTVNGALAISPAAKTLAVNNTFTFSAAGGVSPYTYSIVSGGGSINPSTGAFTAPATAGSVVVRVTDSLSNTANATVTVNAALAINPTSVTLAVNGTASFSAVGGVSPYTFSIVSGGGSINPSTGAFTAPATAGSVVVKVTDSLSNTAQSTVTVNNGLGINPASKTLAVNNTFSFSAVGGVSPYTYSIVSGGGSINASTGAFTAPATAGSVVVRVTDSASNTASATVTVNAALAISPTAKTLAVHNTFSFSAAGGVSPYTYSIVSGGGSINASTGAFTAPATAATVIVRVTDSLSNTSNATVTVNTALAISPAAKTLAVSNTFTFSAAGGVSPYTYSIVSGGGSINSSTGAFTAPATAGSVVVRVTDSLLNTSDSTVTVNAGLAISPASTTLSVNNNFTFSATGGVSPYTYSIVSGGGSIVGSTGAFTAPSTAATVIVRVTDSLSNTSDSTVTVNAGLAISPASTTLAVGNTFTFAATGGVSPYTYSIVSGGGSINASTGAFTAPSTAATVVVRVTDSLSNTSDSTVTVNAALAISPATATVITNGSLSFSASGGVSPYSYSIVSGGGSIGSTTGAFVASATPETVTVQVTDSLSNTSNATITVVASLAISPATKTVAANNEFSFSASGGVTPYTYSIVSGGGSINASTGYFIAPGTAGTVVVRVTDSASSTSNATVTVKPALSISPATANVNVNGTASFTALGGVSPYTYSIVSGGGSINSSTGAFTAPATVGTVVVRVTDSLSNSSNATVTVVNALVLTPTTKTLAVNNTFTFTTTGGVSPYTYSIVSGGGTINASTGAFTAPATAGSVTVKVTDSSSSSVTATVTINPALQISPTTLTMAITGTTTFTSSGGVSPYTYSIVSGGGSIGASTGDFTAPASAATVIVRVTDSLSNTSNATVTVNNALGISPASTNVVVDGALVFSGVGGVSPYTYSIVSGGGTIDPATGDYIAPSTAGNVTIRVTDSASKTANATVVVYDAMTITPSIVTLGVGASQIFTATGGIAPLSFSIVSGGGAIDSSTGHFTAPTTAGPTVVAVTDSLGHFVEADVDVVSGLTISPRTLKLPVFSTATFTATLGLAPYSYAMVSGTGSIDAVTGVYNGGTVAGTDVVEVSDLGSNTSESTVTLVEPVQIVAGGTHYCARYNEGSVKCWGANASGQLGYGNVTNRGIDGTSYGANLPFVNLGTGRTAKFLAAGYNHTCAILDNDSLKCWGANASGQLGLGDTSARGDGAGEMGDALPTVNVGTGRTVKKVAAGASHTCAILDDNTLKCWGLNSNGQLGKDNTTTLGTTAATMGNALTAINLGAGRTAKDVSAGLDQTCAVLDNNTAKCWGRNNRGQLGVDSKTTLGDTAGEMAALATVKVGAGRTVQSISAGYSHTCAILDDNTAKCWGLGTSGQLGRDNTTTCGNGTCMMSSILAINLGSGFTPAVIQANRTRTCALSTTGAVKCWGLNTNGQLGKGSTAILGDAAGEMAALGTINLGTSVTATQMASAWYSTCVITNNKRIKCFGQATSGQLLNGNATSHIGDVTTELGDNMPWLNH